MGLINKTDGKILINGKENLEEDNKTITWIFEEKLEEFYKEYNISKKINYTVVYKNIADISSSRNNKLVNSATGTTFVDNKILTTDRDTEDVIVEIKGNLVVKHLEKDTLNIQNFYSLNINSVSHTSTPLLPNTALSDALKSSFVQPFLRIT